jgi:hypothetical protein
VTAFIILMAVLVNVPAHAQRHGRADAVQNYYNRIPDSALTVAVATHKIRWRTPQLAKLVQTSIAGLPSNATSVQSFTGVPFADVLPIVVPRSDIVMYEVHYGFFRRRRLQAVDLDSTTDLLVADDQNDGFTNRLTGIRLVAKMRDERIVTIKNVDAITVTTEVAAIPRERAAFTAAKQPLEGFVCGARTSLHLGELFTLAIDGFSTREQPRSVTTVVGPLDTAITCGTSSTSSGHPRHCTASSVALGGPAGLFVQVIRGERALSSQPMTDARDAARVADDLHQTFLRDCAD